MIVNNKLFYIFEHIAGSGSVTQSARITCIDLNTGEVNEIPSEIDKEHGIFGNVKINSSDNDTNAYKEYITNLEHLDVLSAEDYADFSDSNISTSGDESGILQVGYYERIGDYEYVFLTYGKFTQYDGWRSMYIFKKCALYEKNATAGTSKQLYSTASSLPKNIFIDADDKDLDSFKRVFADIKDHAGTMDYDFETAKDSEIISLLMGSDEIGIAGSDSKPKITLIEDKLDPAQRFTAKFPDGDYYKYYGYWSIPFSEIEDSASRYFGYTLTLPDELYFDEEKTALWAYKYKSDYYVGIPSGIDGAYGNHTVDITSYKKQADNKYLISCATAIEIDGETYDTGNYIVLAGLSMINGKKNWTIYSINPQN